MNSLNEVVAVLWTDRQAGIVEALLSATDVTATGAYAMGAVTYYVAKHLGRLPPRSLLLKARGCGKIGEAIALAESYVERSSKGESMPRPKKKNAAPVAEQQARAATAPSAIRPAQMRQVEKQVSQLLAIGTNLQSFISLLSGTQQPVAATAGTGTSNTQQKARSGKKAQGAGAHS